MAWSDAVFLGTDAALPEPWHALLVLFLTAIRVAGGVALFSWRLPRKPRFGLRLAAVVAAVSVVYVAAMQLMFYVGSPSVAGSYLAVYGSFTVLLGILYLGFRLLFEASGWTDLFCVTAGYTLQNLATGVAELVATVQRHSGIDPSQPGIYLLVNALSIAAVFGAGYLLVARKIDREGLAQVENHDMLVMMPVVSLMIIGLDVVIKAMEGAGAPLYFSVFLRVFHGMTCGIVIWTEYQMLFRSRLEREQQLAERLLAEHDRQLRASRENIEAINIKCHDLRHQIRALSSGGAAVDGAVLEDLAKTVRVYDSSVQTGNQALDTILTEKRLLCESRGITLTCIADGEALAQVSAADIYSLFGNALDNAIEAVGQLDDPARRSITLVVRRAMGCASVHVENYCCAPVATGPDGLPLTTKKDQVNHGFGVRSMKAVAEKYRGSLSLHADGDTFALDVMIPLGQVG